MFLVHVVAFSVNDWSNWLFELLESVSCAIRASPLPSFLVVVLCAPNDLCQHHWTTMSFELLLDIIFSCIFHAFSPEASLDEYHPLADWAVGDSAGGNALVSFKKEEKTEAYWMSVNSRFVSISRTFLRHCIILVSYLWKLYKQFNGGESSPSIMCTNTTLMF